MKAAAAAAVALGVAFPFVPGLPPYWVTLADYAAVSAIVALGIVVLTGVAGVVSFGQAMFVGFGAYATALLTTRAGWAPLAALPVSVLGSAALAAAIGSVTLRLKGHYLPVATIAWNVSFFYLAGSLDLVRRYEGLSGLPPIAIGPISFADPARFYLLALAVLVAALVLTRNLLDSRVGRTLRSLRGGTLAAESFGVDTGRARILAFTYAGTLAGLGGWLYAHLQRTVNPSPFGLTASIDFLLMAVVGGVGHLGGAVLGSALVTVVRDKLQDVLPALVGQGGNYEQIVFGIVLVLLLRFAPEGLWPHLARLRGRRAPHSPPACSPGEARQEGSGVGVAQDETPRSILRDPHPGPPRKGEGEAAPPSSALPPSGSDLLVVESLRKTFGGLVAVNDLSFTVGPGEIVGLIGPNGAGKSTSFNLITGVAAPTAGRVWVAGRDVTGWPARRIARLGLARTFQHVKLVGHMSVADNVALGRHLRGRAGALAGALRLDRPEEAAIRAEARRQLARVGLGGLADVPAGDLALGQQRLVEIARALCLDPVLLLLDEPAAGLRHAEKEALAVLLRRLRQEGVAVLLVEHDMDFVMRLVDRLVVMNFGAELAQGRPADIRQNPAVREAYLGSAG